MPLYHVFLKVFVCPPTLSFLSFLCAPLPCLFEGFYVHSPPLPCFFFFFKFLSSYHVFLKVFMCPSPYNVFLKVSVCPHPCLFEGFYVTLLQHLSEGFYMPPPPTTMSVSRFLCPPLPYHVFLKVSVCPPTMSF